MIKKSAPQRGTFLYFNMKIVWSKKPEELANATSLGSFICIDYLYLLFNIKLFVIQTGPHN